MINGNIFGLRLTQTHKTENREEAMTLYDCIMLLGLLAKTVVAHCLQNCFGFIP